MRSEPYLLLSCDECGAEEEILLTTVPSAIPCWNLCGLNDRIKAMGWASKYDSQEDFYKDYCPDCESQ